MSQPESTIVMRSFTRAFKIPILIGKFEGGVSLPGGPYALVQVVAMVGTYLAAIVLRPLWGQWGVLDFIAAAIPALAAGFLAGKISFGARGPVAIAASLIGGMSSPTFGSYHGKALGWPGRSLGELFPSRPALRVLVIADHVTATPALRNPAPATVAQSRAQQATPAGPTPPQAGQPAAGGPPVPARPVLVAAFPGRDADVTRLPNRTTGPGPVTAIERLLAAAEKVS
ncbi:MAG: hypothetical protein L0H96_16270 [Humibacillus sp.]|nr:hypothetical protein [Humibacillus sp.]